MEVGYKIWWTRFSSIDRNYNQESRSAMIFLSVELESKSGTARRKVLWECVSIQWSRGRTRQLQSLTLAWHPILWIALCCGALSLGKMIPSCRTEVFDFSLRLSVLVKICRDFLWLLYLSCAIWPDTAARQNISRILSVWRLKHIEKHFDREEARISHATRVNTVSPLNAVEFCQSG